jgi:transcriptional regulator with XRE-family HTH domain
MGTKGTEDPSMRKVRKLLKASGMTQQQLGELMGYPAASARQSVSQFLRSSNPQIDTLRRFAKALGERLDEVL